MTNLGFLYVTNVADYDEATLLKYTQWIFRVPKEELKKIYLNHFNSENKNVWRGFTPFIENDPSLKQFFEIGLIYD